MVKVHCAEVFQGSAHFGNFPSWQEGHKVPVPIEVENLTGQADGEVRRGQMIQEKGLTSWCDPDLLSAFLKVPSLG
jgi:hypothetical protein